MLATIKTILKLLEELSQIKSELADMGIARAGAKHSYNPYRTELFASLCHIKAKLNLYSEKEISLAKKLETLKAQHKESAWHKDNNLVLSKPVQIHEDDFLRMLIFYYLLAEGKQVQAFLSLSFGWVALFFDGVDHKELKHKPRGLF
jgi:hypothetical protein